MTNPYAPSVAAADSTLSQNNAITDNMKDALRGTRGWVKLVGILLFIGAAFTVLVALGMLVVPAMGGGGKGAIPAAAMAFMALLYVGISLVYVFLGMYLVKYAGAIGRLLIDNQTATMEAALQYQQKFWKMAGVLALIMLVISVLGIVAAIAIPIFARR